MVVKKEYPRFRLAARIEHAILIVSFSALALTGLPQMYAETTLGQNLIGWMGGIELVRIIHRWMAFILVAGAIYHLFTSAYRLFVKEEKMAMLPERKDGQDLVQWIRYNLGRAEKPPKMAKFNFGEKFEYWALVWGTGVMIITGFMLWNPIATTNILPGQIIPAAQAAHGGEALLAVLAIIIWHMYNVHIKHFNPSMFTGKLPRHQMEEEHALEMERLDKGGRPWPELDLPVRRRRERNYIIISVIVGVLILAVLIWAFTFEETALETIDRATREVFVPLATPLP
jgi:formate dehydrogenase gamma subunit